MSVLLPAPFSPRIPRMEAGGTSIEIPALARTGPKVLQISRSSISIITPAKRTTEARSGGEITEAEYRDVRASNSP